MRTRRPNSPDEVKLLLSRQLDIRELQMNDRWEPHQPFGDDRNGARSEPKQAQLFHTRECEVRPSSFVLLGQPVAMGSVGWYDNLKVDVREAANHFAESPFEWLNEGFIPKVDKELYLFKIGKSARRFVNEADELRRSLEEREVGQKVQWELRWGVRHCSWSVNHFRDSGVSGEEGENICNIDM